MVPRFLLVLGHQLRGQMAPPWPGAGRDPSLAPADGGWVAWRLVGSNNRELARSAQVFSTTEAARAGARELRGEVECATVMTEATHGLWVWQLSLAEVPVAVASRLYQRPRECSYSVAAALAAIKIAQLD